jgi:hypothetical protein
LIRPIEWALSKKPDRIPARTNGPATDPQLSPEHMAFIDADR